MPHRNSDHSDADLSRSFIRLVIDEHESTALPRLNQLWAYYRNPLAPVGHGAGAARNARWYTLAQERGLPTRIRGRATPGFIAEDDRAGTRREVVVENDIGWRIHAMVDFMFGKPISIRSTARDESTRGRIERALDTVWEASGGISLLADLALLGHVHGHVDLLLSAGELTPRKARQIGGQAAEAASTDDQLLRAARTLRIEAIEPRRGIPVLDENDYRRLAAYVIHYRQALNRADDSPGAFERIVRRSMSFLRETGSDQAGIAPSRRTAEVLHIITPRSTRTEIDGRLVSQTHHTLFGGLIPIVHIQNVAQPFQYSGLSEVEPLIPLQDELNTRLSDRACRVTMQSFKMYLAKGIDGFEKVAVGPGQIWSTDNIDAKVEEFGGDADSPSEASHIAEIREAMDKTSGVPPLASGVVRAKIGNLTSANALRITLMGILSKTARKRVTYGRGIAQMCGLILTALDSAGVLPTSEEDRGIRIEWPDPLPVDVRELVETVRAKAALGVPTDRLLAELGHTPSDPGLT